MSDGSEDFDHREERARWKREGDYDRFADCMRKIRRVDLRLVDISDFLVAHIDTEVYAWGTPEEITLANRQKKPVLVWCRQGKLGAPDWLFGQIPHQHIFDTRDDLMVYLSKIDSGEIEDDTRRWLFVGV